MTNNNENQISCDCSSCPKSGNCEKEKQKQALQDLKYETPVESKPE